MVLKEDGTKWACQSCLKGHRVSGCNHTDRELILVPKKGRPVTQCQHCRQERKKRSAHVSCDCAQPEKPHHVKEKCIHLKEAEEKAKASGFHAEQDEKDPAHLVRVAEEQGCCCGHGGKCSCALLMKQEAEDDSTLPHGPAVKPKLEKATSEGSITVFHNGHHKPVHRKNHAAHECGMPYKVPMPRHHTDQSVHKARRSVDNLPLDGAQSFQPSPFAFQAAEAQTSEQARSGHVSPKVLPFRQGNGSADPRMDMADLGTLSQTQTNQSVQSAATSSFGMPSFEPMSGMADNCFDPWSAYPSADSSLPSNNFFGTWPTSVNAAQPALTAASSGTTSEIDEIPPIEETWDFMMPSILEDPDLEMNSLPFRNSPQTNRRSLPPDMFSSIDFAIPSSGNQRQMSSNDIDLLISGKEFTPQNRQTTSFDGNWQMAESRPPLSVAQHQMGGLPVSSRPSSRSVGPFNSPDNDLMRQLFPELDVNGFNGGSGTNSAAFQKFNGTMQSSGPTSAPIDFGPMDETTDTFTSQPWTDGSLSIPSDVVTSPWSLDQDFSNPDFTGNWSQ